MRSNNHCNALGVLGKQITSLSDPFTSEHSGYFRVRFPGWAEHRETKMKIGIKQTTSVGRDGTSWQDIDRFKKS